MTRPARSASVRLFTTARPLLDIAMCENDNAHFTIANQPALIVIDTNGTTQTFLGAVDEAAVDTALTGATKT